eukprot:3558788-Ditylum_brightwellii.AAC.1
MSSLVARREGLSKNVTFVCATTLEEEEYQLKTALDLVISSTLCNIYKASAHKTEFNSPDQVVSIMLAILGFVDDVTTWEACWNYRNVHIM